MINQKDADAHSLQYDAIFKCISLGVHSSLESHGLISTITRELTKHKISSNIFSGYFHDHIFVQDNLAAEALKSNIITGEFLRFLMTMFTLIIRLTKRRDLC